MLRGFYECMGTYALETLGTILEDLVVVGTTSEDTIAIGTKLCYIMCQFVCSLCITFSSKHILPTSILLDYRKCPKNWKTVKCFFLNDKKCIKAFAS